MRRSKRVTKLAVSRRNLERFVKEGDNPVGENRSISFSAFPSTSGHVESRGNLGGPPPKTKYSLLTDSAQVP
jgi:hypothetical protein